MFYRLSAEELSKRFWDPARHPRGWRGEFVSTESLDMPSLSKPEPGVKDLADKGRPDGLGTPDDPIDVQGNTDRALLLLAQGKNVRLNHADEVTLVADEVNKLGADFKAHGENMPNVDFGKLTLTGTNLFTAQSEGIPRAKMPQLSGVAAPGSEAARIAGGAGKNVDLTGLFRKDLEAHGIKVTDEIVPSSHLRATQDQLKGSSVAGIAQAWLDGVPAVKNMMKEPIFITRDNYIIDGHHRWAASMVLDSRDGTLGSTTMEVHKADMDIGQAIPYANDFANRMGIPPQGMEGNTTLVQKKFDPFQLRGPDGRWTRGDGSGSSGRSSGHGSGDDMESRLGRCYELSGKYVMDHSGTTLIHGSIQGFGHPRIGHAWAVTKSGDIWEPATNQTYPKPVFDAIFNPEVDSTYTHSEALKQMVQHETYGPWDAEKSAETPELASTHRPLGTHGLWGDKASQLPAYIQNIAHAMIRDGHDTSSAIALAVAAVKRWAAGGNHVTPEVQAAAGAALAEWEKLRAEHAAKSGDDDTAVRVSFTAAELAGVVKVGPHGWEHGWKFVGIPVLGTEVKHPDLGTGHVTSHTDDTVTARFPDAGKTKTFSRGTASPGSAPAPGHLEPAPVNSANSARLGSLAFVSHQSKIYTDDQVKSLQDQINQLQAELHKEKHKEKKVGVAIEIGSVIAAVGLSFITGGLSLGLLGPAVVHESPNIGKAIAEWVHSRIGRTSNPFTPLKPGEKSAQPAASMSQQEQVIAALTDIFSGPELSEADARAFSTLVVAQAAQSLAAGKFPGDDGFISPENIQAVKDSLIPSQVTVKVSDLVKAVACSHGY